MSKTPALPEEHLPREVLDAFFAGSRSIGEVGSLAVDLLTEHCPDCRRRLETASISIGEAFAQGERRIRAMLADLERERAELPDLLAPLLALGPTETLVRVAGDHRYHSVAFVEHELAVAWEGFEQGVASVVDQAWTLALVGIRGLDVGRYGRPVLCRLEAELWLLEARDSIRRRDFETAQGSFRAAGKLLQEAGRPEELGGLELLGAAELAMAQEKLTRAQRVASTALSLLRRSDATRWRLPLERLLARIDRLEGRPREAAERLLGLLGGERGLEGALEWSVGREALSALIEAECAEEAYAWFLMWWEPGEWGEESGAPASQEARAVKGWRVGDEVGERELVLGLVLRALGRPEEALRYLQAVRRRSLRMGLGRDAMEASVELLRLHLEAGDEDALRDGLAHVEALAECPDVPRSALRELVRFAAEAWRGRVGDLARVERCLLLDSGAPKAHGPG